MTAAQTAAKAKFKKAIAYRQKTGVSLKEAFAHVYGKKVGAAPKKKAAKKAAPKKAAKKVVKKVVKKAAPKKVARKKHTKYGKVKAHTRRVAGVVKKKVSEKQVLNKIHKVKNQVTQLDQLQHKHMMGSFDKHIFSKLENVSKEIDQRENVIKSVISRKIDLVSKNGLSWYKNFLKEAKGYVAELKKHKTELKKFI
jgi:predicted PilT family ATPase